MLPSQKQAAQAIVNVFETGVPLGDYGQVTLIAGDTGHLTYGRSQTTLGSGNLHALLARYCATAGARFAARLAPALPRFAARDPTLDRDGKLRNLLRAAADDRTMREVQDAFFDETYWQPAARTDLRATVYRMYAFQRLIEQGDWGLELPLVVRGCEISAATLAGAPPGCYDGPVPGSRVLRACEFLSAPRWHANCMGLGHGKGGSRNADEG